MADIDLTTRQYKAIDALLTEASVKDAATVARVGVRTMFAWLRDSTFEAEYRRRRRQLVSQASAQLQQGAARAVMVLLALAENTGTPAAVRRAAAKDVLDLALRSVEVDDLAARVAVLELELTDARATSPDSTA